MFNEHFIDVAVTDCVGILFDDTETDTEAPAKEY